MSSNALPSTGVTNQTVCDMVDTFNKMDNQPDPQDDPVDTSSNMDNQPDPQDDPIDLQSDERQSAVGQESRWGSHRFVAFVSFSFGVTVAYIVMKHVVLRNK